MKVLFLTNVPVPYRVDFFNELGKYCDLTVLFEKNASTERDESWKKYSFTNFKGIILNGLSTDVDSAFCPEVIRFLKKEAYDHIVVTNFLSPTGMLAILWMRARRMQYWLESDGGFAKNGAGFKENIKRFFIKNAYGYFSTAEEHDKYYVQYGADINKLYRYPFTSVKEAEVVQGPVTADEMRNLRQLHDIQAENVLVSIGSFIHRKGHDVLLKAMAHLKDLNVQLVIIGGKPTDEYISVMEEYGIQNVKFVEFVPRATVNEYMRLANLFVLLTREDIWGLVVNEAMAAGTPVITTQRCIAGLELVKSSDNGRIVPVDDPEAAAAAIRSVLSCENQEKMRMQSIAVASAYTIEKMAQKHVEIFNK